MSDVTRILSQIQSGDPSAAEHLLPLVYDELRKLASQRMANEQPGQTLEATALVHEAYVRLVDGNAVEKWDSRGHFFAAAAEAMRRILIDRARGKDRLKRGGGWQRVDLDGVATADAASDEDLLLLDDSLERLANEHPMAAQVVKLRFFGGLSAVDTARALGISLRTANRHWAFARAWLFQTLEAQSE